MVPLPACFRYLYSEAQSWKLCWGKPSASDRKREPRCIQRRTGSPTVRWRKTSHRSFLTRVSNAGLHLLYFRFGDHSEHSFQSDHNHPWNAPSAFAVRWYVRLRPRVWNVFWLSSCFSSKTQTLEVPGDVWR